jgi:hypothetical protein
VRCGGAAGAANCCCGDRWLWRLAGIRPASRAGSVLAGPTARSCDLRTSKQRAATGRSICEAKVSGAQCFRRFSAKTWREIAHGQPRSWGFGERCAAGWRWRRKLIRRPFRCAFGAVHRNGGGAGGIPERYAAGGDFGESWVGRRGGAFKKQQLRVVFPRSGAWTEGTDRTQSWRKGRSCFGEAALSKNCCKGYLRCLAFFTP